MSFVDGVLDRVPPQLRDVVYRHRELVKFAIVGGTTFIFDMAIYYSLAYTLLEDKPVVAKVISGVLATILSYFLNRDWSFRHRGGRAKHHEALGFFGISGIGVLIAALPLWTANNLFDWRAGHSSQSSLWLLDFLLNYIIGNLMQMGFRFWALRRWVFLENPEPASEVPSPKS